MLEDARCVRGRQPGSTAREYPLRPGVQPRFLLCTLHARARAREALHHARASQEVQNNFIRMHTCMRALKMLHTSARLRSVVRRGFHAARCAPPQRVPLLSQVHGSTALQDSCHRAHPNVRSFSSSSELAAAGVPGTAQPQPSPHESAPDASAADKNAVAQALFYIRSGGTRRV